MVDFLVFLSTQFFNLILFLDNITIVGSLSLLKVLIITILFLIGLKFLNTGGSKK